MLISSIVENQQALDYINQRGYISYSSLACYRDGKEPGGYGENAAFDFGTELHSRFLEHRVTKVLSLPEEKLLAELLSVLQSHKLVTEIMKGSYVEAGFVHPVQGVLIKGYIDIFKPGKLVADLKTTSAPNLKAFKESMDLLQAAIYTTVTGVKEFYYIGIGKKTKEVYPYRVTSAELKSEYKTLNQLLNEIRRSKAAIG